MSEPNFKFVNGYQVRKLVSGFGWAYISPCGQFLRLESVDRHIFAMDIEFHLIVCEDCRQ